MKDGLYKKSIFGLIAVGAFGIAVFLNNPQDQSASNQKRLESANISEIAGKIENPEPEEISDFNEMIKEAAALEKAPEQSSGGNLEDLLKNL